MTFLGLVRNHNLGRRVRYLEYEAYEPLALKAFERIADEIGERWPSARLALHHRIGRLEVGEASIAIATRSPHRGDAYAACRYAIERIKQIAPIWKHEFFDGGDVWIEGATANPDDRAGARRSGAARMRVTVRLFARLRDIAGAAELARELAPGATIGDVWRQLAGEFPELASYERSISSAINADYARMDQVVGDGDEIAFLPPVSGG